MFRRRMKPSEIRFSQDSIKSTFQRGDDVHEVTDQVIRAGHDGPIATFLLPITVFYNEQEQEWFAKNNRTLYVCRVLEYEGIFEDIPAKEVSEQSIRYRKITTSNNGESVKIRGNGPVRPHSIQEIQNKQATRQWESVAYRGMRQRSGVQSRQVQQQQQNSSSESGLGWGATLAMGAVAVAGLLGAAAANSSRRMKPSEIRFSQDSISSTFKRGDDVHEVIDRVIRTGHDGPIATFLLPITVFYNKQEQEWFAKNNRTLYVCRVLEYEGILEDIPVKEVSEQSIRSCKMTTRNNGESVKIRGNGPVRPHSIQEDPPRRERERRQPNGDNGECRIQ